MLFIDIILIKIKRKRLKGNLIKTIVKRLQKYASFCTPLKNKCRNYSAISPSW